jgi:hypothetical protein
MMSGGGESTAVVNSALDLAELIFLHNVPRGHIISFQSSSIGSGKELFGFLLTLFEHGLSLMFARPEHQNMVLLNELTMEDIDAMRVRMAYAGIELIVTKRPGRIMSPNHYAMALTCKQQQGKEDDRTGVEDYVYMVDLPAMEHACISFRLSYPFHNQIHPCGMTPSMLVD